MLLTMSNEQSFDKTPDPLNFLSTWPSVSNPLSAMRTFPERRNTSTVSSTKYQSSHSQTTANRVSSMATTHIPILPLLHKTDFPANQLPQNQVPEFLVQLMKMLTDDNRQYIEWANGRIEVHDPPQVEQLILGKYYRHSKYASFQRQLNYFGFRKLAGNGKMAPCSYTNDATTDDLSSLLLIKRKTTSLSGKSRKRDSSDRSSSPENIAELFKNAERHEAKKSTASGFPTEVSSSADTKNGTSNNSASHSNFPARDTNFTDENATKALQNINFQAFDEFVLQQNTLEEVTNSLQKSAEDESRTGEAIPYPSAVPSVAGVPVTLGMLSPNSSLIDLAQEADSYSSSPMSDIEWDKILV